MFLGLPPELGHAGGEEVLAAAVAAVVVVVVVRLGHVVAVLGDVSEDRGRRQRRRRWRKWTAGARRQSGQTFRGIERDLICILLLYYECLSHLLRSAEASGGGGVYLPMPPPTSGKGRRGCCEGTGSCPPGKKKKG